MAIKIDYVRQSPDMDLQQANNPHRTTSLGLQAPLGKARSQEDSFPGSPRER